MQQTTNYNLLIPEGTDVVNPLTQVNPNFQTIDGAMFANKQASIGTASEVVTGTVHAIIRNNTDSDVFRFTATGAWTSGDTMTLDGQSVTVHLSDGTTPATNSYIIGAEVLAMVNGSLVTLAISTTPPAQGVTSFNSRTGAVVPASSDYDSSMIDYDNTVSGLNATDVQGAIDEIVSTGSNSIFKILWETTAPGDPYSGGSFSIDLTDVKAAVLVIAPDAAEGRPAKYYEIDVFDGVTRTVDNFHINGNGQIVNYFRTVSITNAGLVTISNGSNTTVNTYGSAPTYQPSSNVLVPYKILGIMNN